MKSILTGVGAVLALSFLAAVAQAQRPDYLRGGYYAYPNPYCPPPPGMPRQAPDMCGPGFYYMNPCGMRMGPNYNVYPPFPPVGTVPPNFGQNNNGGGSRPFMPHPFARGPRDYFMLDQ